MQTDINNTVGPPLLLDELIDRITSEFPGSVLDSDAGLDMACLRVAAKDIVSVCRWLRDADRCVYKLLSDLTAVDYLGRDPRFEVVYHLYSFDTHAYLRLKVGVPESPCECPTVTSVWEGANWLEREVFDMFGITFANHPDLRRIVTPEGWPYFALRRDFPLQGPGMVKLYDSVSDVF
jgi:NADH-quinone oxidoreductase subunit C